ncbi:MAG: 3-deoxy-D-manno-octulosonic acid transferase, partial [Nitrospirae bacterium]
MYLLYNTLLVVAAVVTLPYWVWRYLTTPKYKEGLRQRLGRLPPEVAREVAGRPVLWVHAVSVGETLASLRLVEALHAAYPRWRVVFSTVTATGQRVARERVAVADQVIYFPLDFPWAVRRVVRAIRPRLFVVLETEIWPNCFRELGRLGVPIVIANGRLSPSSFRGYRRLRPFMRRFLEPVACFAMQSQGDAERVRAIGADPARVVVTGNLKYDEALNLPDAAAMAELAGRIGEPTAEPVWICASTHEGEETACLDAYRRLAERVAGLRLLLAPRHPERCDAVAAEIERRGLAYLRLTRAAGRWREPVLLVDAVGWVMRLFRYATVAFVGGSLVATGGHNLLEPAAWGVPVCFGPHTFNFPEITERLLAAGGGVR